MRALDAAHGWALRHPLFRVATIGVRVLLALAFVPSGLVKILGQPFTSLPTSDPVGYFFAGFFSAHDYYRFVGVAQWTAAALLLAGAGLAFFGVTSAHVARLGGASVARAALPVMAGVGLALLGLVMAYRRARVDLGAPTAGPLTSRAESRYP